MSLSSCRHGSLTTTRSRLRKALCTAYRGELCGQHVRAASSTAVQHVLLCNSLSGLQVGVCVLK
jgi:hypothetical protein